MKRVLSKLKWRIRVLLTKLGIKRQYRIGNIYIELDYTHSLPDYQSGHAYYDRFLPHLAKHLPSNRLVIDVGANVGDTLVGMIDANASLEYVCIEADKSFFDDLAKNINTIKAQVPNANIHAVNVFVGKEVNNVSLEGSNGTKHAVIGAGDIESQPLDKVLNDLGLDAKLSLLKTDVDGFDYDVIRSSEKLLSDRPLIYFECHYENENQLNGYKSLFNELIERGYSSFALFDNFGQYITKLGAVEQLNALLEYVARQNLGRGTRTFYYYDILAFDEDKREFVDGVINDYVDN
jgi:FkbM family methyltransferase